MHRYLPFCFLLAATVANAADWAQFRGPNFNGSTSEQNLPTEFSKTENIAWVAEMPGPSSATPVIYGDSVFVSSTDTKSETLKAMCYDRKTGKLLWQHVVAKGIDQDSRSNYSAPSPVTDGKLAIFFYGNGDMVAYTVKGEKQWSNNYGPFAFGWTFSTSPLLYAGKLYLQVCQRDVPVRNRGAKKSGIESYLLAIEPETGKTLWRAERPSQAHAESREAFSSPIPYEHNGRKEILIVGGDDVTGHDPETGKELWRWGTWNPERIGHWRLVPSPVAGDGVILACAPKKSPIYAVKAGGNGQLTDQALAWVSEDTRELTSDVPTPAFYDGDFFVLSKSRTTVARVEPKSGKVKWIAKLPSRVQLEASPLAADGKIYTLDFDGQVTVIDAASGDIINTIPMGDEARSKDQIRSCIVAAHGQLFIRTNTKLYCVGK